MRFQKLILASKSPRRREFFTMLGLDFTVSGVDVDETLRTDLPVSDAMCDLARRKALACELTDNDTLIVSADTVVLSGNEILGKPKDREDALRMMRGYSASSHEVLTAFAIRSGERIYAQSVTTEVFFRKMSEDEIAFYVDTVEPYDKAGAYGIQGAASLFIEKIEGDYNNVVGLPLFALDLAMQKEFGVSLLDFRKKDAK